MAALPFERALSGLALFPAGYPWASSRRACCRTAGASRCQDLGGACQRLARPTRRDRRLGVESVEKILLAAAAEWAAAYLHAANTPEDAEMPRPQRRGQLRDLLCKAPDPSASRESLSVLRDPEDADTRWLVRGLFSDSDLRDRVLRDLLPGLGLIESPRFSIRLSVRAANCLARANAITLTALAGMTPTEILALADMGKKTGEEVLLAILGEWATPYLDSIEDRLTRRPGSQWKLSD